MLIANKKIETDTFYIPPFDLNCGEIVVLNLFSGDHFNKTEIFLKDIFYGRTQNENVTVHQHLTFAEHFFEPKIRRIFYPVTVGEYLKKNTNSDSPYATKIDETQWINEETKVNILPGSLRKQLYICDPFKV